MMAMRGVLVRGVREQGEEVTCQGCGQEGQPLMRIHRSSSHM
jgi:hypothetical protein